MTALLNEPLPPALDLDGMTKNQLLDYAAQNGVGGVNSAMKKADIIAIINGGDADG